MRLFSKITAGVFLGSVLASLPITYICQYGMNQEFHAGAAIIGSIILGACLFFFAVEG